MPQRLRLFLSSPGDLPDARLRAELVVEKLGQDFARYFTLETYRWEHEPMLASGHFQDVIEAPSAFDIVVLVVWTRLGTPLPVATGVREYRGLDGRAPVTGTEWEFEDALKVSRERGSPDILAFRNLAPAEIDAADAKSRAGSLAQMDALDAFWRRHFYDDGKFIGAHENYRTLSEFAEKLEQSLRKLIERRVAARAPAARSHGAPVWAQRPFRGLESYGFEHSAIFFGRDGAVAEAAELLTRRAREGLAFLVVAGASGSGKSSLVKAALVPRLMKPQRVQGVGILRRAAFRPGDARDDVFQGLAEALTREGALAEWLGPGQSAGALARLMREGGGGLDFSLAQALGRIGEAARRQGSLLEVEEPRAVLVVDQFEELFTLCELAPADRSAFARCLRALAGGGVFVVVTIRDDFSHRLAEESFSALTSEDAVFRVRPPSVAEIAEIIRKPAEAARVVYENHAVTGVGLDSVLAERAAGEPGALPLLSFTLDQIYSQDIVARGGTVLTFATYESLGGLEGAIAARAEEVFSAAPPAAQAALPRLLRALTTASNSPESTPLGRPAPLDEFPEGSPARTLADALIGARLLVADRSSVRLAHESLLAQWTRARDQIAADRRDIDTRAILERQHERWKRAPSDGAALLLRDPDLMLGRDLARRWGEELSKPLVDYIAASASAAQRAMRRRRLAIAGIGFALLALTGASLAGLALAERQRNEALIAQSLSLARDSTNALESGDATLAMNLALAALPRDLAHPDRPYLAKAEAALAAAFSQRRELADYTGHDGAIDAVAFSPDGKRLLAAGDKGLAWLWRVGDPAKSTLLRHDNGERIWSTAFSPDGSRIATASNDHTVRLWNGRDGGLIRELNHDGAVQVLSFSADSQRLLTGAWDGVARLWSAKDGAALREAKPLQGNVVAIAFAPGGARAAIASDQDDTRLVDVATMNVRANLSQAHETCNAVAFSPDGKRVATAGDDGIVRLWDAESGERLNSLRGGERALTLAFSPDGRRLGAGFSDKTVRLWSVVDGAEEREFKGVEGDFAFSPDGRKLAGVGLDGTMQLWDVEGSDTPVVFSAHGGATQALAFSPDGRQIAVGDAGGVVRMWSVEPTALIGEFHAGAAVAQVSFSPDGALVAVASPEGQSELFDAQARSPRALGDPGAGLVALAFAPDGKRLASASRRGPASLWDVATAARTAQLGAEGAPSRAVVFSNDGATVATVPQAGAAHLWSTAPLADLGAVGSAALNAIALSRDGKEVATADARDNDAHIWRVDPRAQIATLAKHNRPINSIAFSPDGQSVLTASYDATAGLWNARGENVATLRHGNTVVSAFFSPDGLHIATVSLDHKLKLWTAAGAPENAVSPPGAFGFAAAAFSPDSKRVATASNDGVARLWDTRRLDPLAQFVSDGSPLTAVAFSPDASCIATGSESGAARLWRTPPACQALIDAALQAAPHRLSPDQRVAYGLEQEHMGALETLYAALRPISFLLAGPSRQRCE